MKVRRYRGIGLVLLASIAPSGCASPSRHDVERTPAVVGGGEDQASIGGRGFVRRVSADDVDVLQKGDADSLQTTSEPPASKPAASESMTLADLEQLALENNPTLGQASARVQAARGNWQQAGRPQNPRIAYEGGEIGDEGRQGMQGGFISQEFSTGGKLRLNQAIAEQEIVQAEQRLEAQRFRVLSDVRSQYYASLAAQRSLDLAQELVQVGEKAVETTKAALRAGTASRVDLLQAQIEADVARINLENARNRRVAAWRRLASIVGDRDMRPARLTGDVTKNLPDLPWDEVLARLLTESPEMEIARAGVARAELAVQRARREPIPNITVMTGVQKNFASRDTVANLQMELPIPLYNRNLGAIYQAQSELSAAHGEVSRVELSLHSRLADTYQRYANARQQVERYAKNILPNAKDSLELVGAGYKQGEFSFLAVLMAQRTYFQTNMAYIDALAELWDSAVSIEGLLLRDSLQMSDSGPSPATPTSPAAPPSMMK